VYDGETYLEDFEDWHWWCLESPPYMLETTRITAYTMPGIGTYSFNTFAGGT
jgi:hypothetical protein